MADIPARSFLKFKNFAEIGLLGMSDLAEVQSNIRSECAQPLLSDRVLTGRIQRGDAPIRIGGLPRGITDIVQDIKMMVLLCLRSRQDPYPR